MTNNHVNTIIDFSPIDKSEEITTQVRQFIIDFNLSIGNEYEVAMTIPHGNQLIIVRQVYFCKPQLVMIEGSHSDGSPIRVIQSLQQLNFALQAVKRPDPDVPKTPIGFHVGYQK
ncbi:MAG: DUF6173 family protein [bacterium]|nr:DUF6173 family protein [bacterium]